MDLRRGLARSLRLIRKARGLAQEELSEVSGRTYLSEIERGIKNPTVEKIDALARAMDVHPLTILALAYLPHWQEKDLDSLSKFAAADICSEGNPVEGIAKVLPRQVGWPILDASSLLPTLRPIAPRN